MIRIIFFFFSSRRRHTRLTCDWSSDVCSSDLGHLEAFTGGDVIARYKWMRGYNVLHPIGWDGFGLPAENAAIKRGIHPKEWTYANIEQQAHSFMRLGMSFD